MNNIHLFSHEIYISDWITNKSYKINKFVQNEKSESYTVDTNQTRIYYGIDICEQY